MDNILMPKARTPEFWQRIRENDQYLSNIMKVYQRDRYDEIPSIPFHVWQHFYKTGDRNQYTSYCYRSRRYLSSVALLALIYPEEPKYLAELEDVIWAICEEFSWVCPAHVHFAEDGERTYIDLFSADTASALAEISSLLKDRLDHRVVRRIQEAIDQKIVDNFEKYPMNWEWTDNNWAAHCAFHVGVALAYLHPDKFEKYIPRLWKAMQSYIGGFADDGTCLEGIGYWGMGMSSFTWFMDMVLQFTQGKVDLFYGEEKDKIAKMAAYCQSPYLKGGTVISFSDCDRAGGKVSASLYFYLHKKYPHEVGGLELRHLGFSCGADDNFCSSLRGFYYIEDALEIAKTMENKKGAELREFYFPSSGQVIINKQKYSLAVKAGHNDECCGHNDVGHFILSTDVGQVFCDLGYGSYSREYFDSKTRYLEFGAGSDGHSVPIINGAYQKQGVEHCGTISHSGSIIELEFSKAYGQKNFSKLTRNFVYEEDKIFLTDNFDPACQSVVERFVVLFEPVAEENRVVVANVALEFNPEEVKLNVHPEIHPLPQNETETVYCIDFERKPDIKSVCFTFLF